MQVAVTDDAGEWSRLEHRCQLFQGGHHRVDRGLMRHPRGAERTLNGTSAFSMGVLGFKGTDPSNVLRRIKGLLAQGRKATRREPNLVNPLKDGSHLLPLLVRHPFQATLPEIPA